MDSLFSSTLSNPFGTSDYFNPLKNNNENSFSSGFHSDLESRLYSSLQRVSGGQDAGAVAEIESTDFSPEKIAERVISFVSNALDTRASSEIERQSLLAQAREGVEQGINEAREILSSTGNISDDAGENIEETRQLIFNGLDKLATVADTEDHDVNKTSITDTQSSILSASSQSSRQASIQIETQDGDLVTIDISSFSSTSINQLNVSNDDVTLSAFQKSSKYNFDFNYTIQGELDSGEREAIDDLLKDVNKVAKKFFNGDVQDAFNKALSLGIDGEELAAFSLDLNYSRTTEVITAYQSIENIASEQTTAEPVASIADAVNYAEEINNIIHTSPEKLPFNNSVVASIDLFTLFIEQQFEPATEVENDTVSLLKQLLEHLGTVEFTQDAISHS